MKLKVGLFFIALSFITACSDSSSPAGDSGVDISSSQCRELTNPDRDARQIDLSEFTEEGPIWKLENLKGFQSLSQDNLYSHVGFEAKASSIAMAATERFDYQTHCHSLNASGQVTMNHSIPASFYGNPQKATSLLSGKIYYHQNSAPEFIANVRTVSEDLGISELDPTKIRIYKIGNDRLQVWIRLTPVGSNGARGDFTFLSTYVNYKPQPLEIHKMAFEYANAPTYQKGLELKREQAIEFADKFSLMPGNEAVMSLEKHRTAFQYAFAATYQKGLGENKDRAKTFADVIISKKNFRDLMSSFETHFRYALTPDYQGGLGLNREQALTFASQKTGINW